MGKCVQHECVSGICEHGSRRTDGGVHHMHLERVVLATDTVFRGSVNVVLSKAELSAAKGGGAVHFDLDSRVQVEEL